MCDTLASSAANEGDNTSDQLTYFIYIYIYIKRETDSDQVPTAMVVPNLDL